MDWSHVQAEFKTLLANEETKEGGEVVPFDIVVGSATEELEARFTKARAYARRLGTTITSSPRGHIFINGKYYASDDVSYSTLAPNLNITIVEQSFLNSLQSGVGQALQYFQEKVYSLFFPTLLSHTDGFSFRSIRVRLRMIVLMKLRTTSMTCPRR